MSGQSQGQLIPGNTVAIIADANQFHATVFHLHAQALGTCVQAVFQQLLDDRGWAFHHLTGSNLVSQAIIKEANWFHNFTLVTDFSGPQTD